MNETTTGTASILDQSFSTPQSNGAAEPDSSIDEIIAQRAEFPVMEPNRTSNGTGALDRFFDVTVVVSVELGRVTLPIGDLVKLGKGSVVELDRAVDQPVDLMAQGVKIASGEVIVVNDRYAIRIDDIAAPGSNGTRPGAKAVKRSVLSSAKN